MLNSFSKRTLARWLTVFKPYRERDFFQINEASKKVTKWCNDRQSQLPRRSGLKVITIVNNIKRRATGYLAND